MASLQPDDGRDLLQALSSSGFPFQTAVASAVRAVDRYEVHDELAWRHRDGSDRFLDIVGISKSVRVMIECKKTSSEKFVFLLPSDVSVGVDTNRIWGLYLHQIQTAPGEVRFTGASRPRCRFRVSPYTASRNPRTLAA